MKKSLIEAFEIEKHETNEVILNDYDIFKDKNLLDEFRSRIIENIIDKKVPLGQNTKDFINEEIDKCLEGYDLSNIERNHIYNMICNKHYIHHFIT